VVALLAERGAAVRSCLMFVVRGDESAVTTVDELGSGDDQLNYEQGAFLSGNPCRYTGHRGVVTAVRRAAEPTATP
jgi:aerobic-type carbon monoxide dehydrogenase small subunit (CoxS/CutS family)